MGLLLRVTATGDDDIDIIGEEVKTMAKAREGSEDEVSEQRMMRRLLQSRPRQMHHQPRLTMHKLPQRRRRMLQKMQMELQKKEDGDIGITGPTILIGKNPRVRTVSESITEGEEEKKATRMKLLLRQMVLHQAE